MPTPIRAILAATDFSEPSLRAVERAAHIAGEQGTTLEVITVVPPPDPVPVWGDMAVGAWMDNSEVVAGAEHQLEALLAKLKHHFGFSPHGRCEVGNPGFAVPARAEAIGADLLVIGATGEGAFARRLFGSTANTIARHTPCPLLVVRREDRGTYARVLVATDFSATSVRAARLACRIAPAAGFDLFSALEVPAIRVEGLLGIDAETREANLARARHKANTRLLELAVELDKPGARVHVRDGRASHELDALALAIEADLVVVGSHRKSRLEAGIMGSTSLHAIQSTPCDVLLVPPLEGE